MHDAKVDPVDTKVKKKSWAPNRGVDIEKMLDAIMGPRKGMRHLDACEDPSPLRFVKLSEVLRHVAVCETCRWWLLDCEAVAQRYPPRKHNHRPCKMGGELYSVWIESLAGVPGPVLF